MKVYIAADIEGVAGIVNARQTMPEGGVDYERSRTLMAAEVNAAVTAAMAAGATEVLVNDAHGPNTNLRPEDMHPHIELMTGTPKPYNMVQGIDDTFDALLFVGYHAKAGTGQAILDHTYFGRVPYDITINDVSYGEFGLNAMLAGSHGVPTIFASGDERFTEEVHALLPDVTAISVKSAVSRHAARTLMPERAQQLISDGVKVAMETLRLGTAQPLLPPGGELTLNVTFHYSSQADLAELLPGSLRLDGRTVSFVTSSYPEAFRTCRALILLGSVAA